MMRKIKKNDLPKNVDTSGIEIEVLPFGKRSKETLKFENDFNYPLSTKSREMRKK